ncbi:hypothetical protein LXL04_027555 [Taraxacum kok-saghyz]
MADDGFPPPTRLMNFVSQEQLDESKKTRGPRVEDGTAHRDRPLFEILRENKDKKDAEFNERFKHRPPKALDEDETEFLDRLELVIILFDSRREYEQQLANEEAQQLQSFQEAVAAQSATLQELKEPPPHVAPKPEEQQSSGQKRPKSRAHSLVVIKVKPQAKKAKISEDASGNPTDTGTDTESIRNVNMVGTMVGTGSGPGIGLGLVSYSDESDDD